MWGDGWGNWIVGFLVMALFWGGLILLVLFFVRGWVANQRTGDRTPGRPDARAILEERFVRGEISEDDFEERRRVLEHATR